MIKLSTDSQTQRIQWWPNAQRGILAFPGALLLGSIAAFFLYVPALTILSVTAILIAMMLMFLLGIQAARQPLPAVASAAKGEFSGLPTP
jgi:hypothetical protein